MPRIELGALASDASRRPSTYTPIGVNAESRTPIIGVTTRCLTLRLRPHSFEQRKAAAAMVDAAAVVLEV